MLKLYLSPVQRYLSYTCNYLRLSRNIICWEESFYSFWISIISIALSVVSVFIPWAFIIRWIARIIVWTFLGPWMKLVDIFYVSKLNTGDDDIKIQVDKLIQANNILLHDARIQREDTSKLKAMKTYLFGKFITTVPVLHKDRYVEYPLLDSYAECYEQKKLSLGELALQEGGMNCERIDGQHLVGHMIPKRLKRSISQVHRGQHAKDVRRLSEHSVGANIVGDDSTRVAVAKICSLILVAGIATNYAVEILIKGIHWVT